MQRKFQFMFQKLSWVMTCTVLISALAFITACSSSSNDPVLLPTGAVVNTDQGAVRGEEMQTMHAFRGIPYAAAPVGDLRFAPPEPAPDRAGTLDATQFGSACPQMPGAFGAGSVNEDCLFLNIFTPKGEVENLPVMVWIHGGAYISVSGAEDAYEATRLVAEDVILVTLNYRLGALGFLPHPALTAEAGQSGNYGLMDQQEALRWVQANIQSFGGDPTNVTIFGESAGGHSVLSHMAAAGNDGLFHRAIVQSGSYSAGQVSMTNGYYAFGRSFADIPGLPANASAPCTGISDPGDIRECLRSLTVEEVLTAQGSTWYVPVTGGIFLPQSIDAALDAGEIADVPVMIGSNRHEGQLFVLLGFDRSSEDMSKWMIYSTPEEYQAGVNGVLPAIMNLDRNQIGADYLAFADAQLGLPPGVDHPNRFRVALSNLWTDYMFSCGNLKQWNQLSAHTPTYAYWFTDNAAPNAWDSPALPIGATHTLEIQYVFGVVGERGGSPDQEALSAQLIDFWTQFAKTGNPSSSSTVWQEYTGSDSFVMKLDTPISGTDADEFDAAHQCSAYWAAPPLLER